jgi:hypothetical protein
MNKTRNKEYEFTLVVDSIQDMTPEMAEALFEAGCDDATVGISGGVFEAIFHRESSSFEAAVLSAMSDIRKAVPEAAGFRLDHRDLVSQADIARRTGISRQTVNLYTMGKRTASGKRDLGDFASPVSECDEGALYSWSDVTEWLRIRGLLPDEAAEEADSRRLVGSALDFAYLARDETKAARMNEFIDFAGLKAGA